MRGKKGEEWGNDKKIKFVRIRMTSCREATAMPRSDRRAAAVNDNARSVAASETMLRRASLHRACMLSSLTKNIRCVMKLRPPFPASPLARSTALDGGVKSALAVKTWIRRSRWV